LAGTQEVDGSFRSCLLLDCRLTRSSFFRRRMWPLFAGGARAGRGPGVGGRPRLPVAGRAPGQRGARCEAAAWRRRR
jgi:hypothetical protein